MIKVCFICTGNTCRSIMAERLMKKALKENNIDNVKVSSKGLKADGQQITEKAKKVLKSMKASSINRKSVKLGKIDKDTLYVTMTESQKEQLKTDKILSFKSLLGYDIIDPYGQNEEVYLKTANELKKGIDILIDKIIMWKSMIILASDHAGFPLKEEIKKFFNKENIIAIDVGCYSREQLDDYPDFAKAGNAKVVEDPRNVGIYICGTGIGMSLVANRNPKIRAALCHNENFASLARRHNDANVLCLAGRYISVRKAIKIIKVFLTTDFEAEDTQEELKNIEVEND